MSGAVIEIVAKGSQDAYLTGSPEATQYKSSYKRLTPGADEDIQQSASGTADFQGNAVWDVQRAGDLAGPPVVEIDAPELACANGNIRWIDNPAHAVIEECSFVIGSQTVDEIDSRWMDIWADLTVDESQVYNYRYMIGHEFPVQRYTGEAMPNDRPQAWTADTKEARTWMLTLPFWFAQEVGQRVPLIALQYHDVRIKAHFRRASEMFICSGTAPTGLKLNVNLYVRYTFLGSHERARYSQVAHEYLMRQVQKVDGRGVSDLSVNVNPSFNHPCQAIYWVFQNNAMVQEPSAENSYQGNQIFNYTNMLADVDEDHRAPLGAENPVQYAKIKLNNHDRYALRSGMFHNKWVPLEHHLCGPQSPGINMYSFAQRPRECRPTGSLNLSRIDIFTLIARLLWDASLTSSATLYMWATNHNVLRIMAGMGGTAYAN